jgi:hypothetical protein
MPLYDLGWRTSNVTSANAAVEIIGSNTTRTKVYEIGLTLVTAVATVLGLGRPAAIGVTPGTTSLVQAEDPAEVAGITSIALTWGTSPTAPSIYLRRFAGSAIGQGVIWTFPKGIVLNTSGITRNLVLFNITGGATLDCYMVAEE